MSLFGEHLRMLIKSNNTTIYALARQAGTERTTIHKIINNDRIPSREYVQKLADALSLSPEEAKLFFENYMISSIGEHRYEQRQQVKGIIESIAHSNAHFVNIDREPAKTSLLDGAKSVATGHFAVNNLIKSILHETLPYKDGRQSIDFIIPTSYRFFITNY